MKISHIYLKDICNFLNGGTPSKNEPRYYTGQIPWITSADIVSNEITNARSFITEEAINKSATKLVKKGTVLLVTRTGVGKVALAGMDLCFSQDITGIIPDESELDNIYLAYFLRTKTNYFNNLQRGATIQGITREVIDNLKIPLPSLPEQKRIAAILDKADAVRRKRQETIRLLDEFLRSVFLEMFGDPVRNEKGWALKSFEELAKIDTQMTKDFNAYFNMPHIGIENIEKDTGRLVNYKTVKESNLISGKYIFNSEHIIYSKIRPNLNKVALPSFSGLCSADSYPILVNKRICNRYFFAFIMRSKFFLDFIISLSSRTNIPKVNKEQLNSFYCICPSVEIQNKFAQIFEKTEQQKHLLEKNLKEMENGLNSMMQKAFRGEL
jgi:type I restriction enzyme S subunit